MLDGNKADSSTLIRTAQLTLKGSRKEMQQTWENGKSEKHMLYDSSSAEATITAKDLSITCSPEAENSPRSEIDLRINYNLQDFGEVQNIQPDKDDRAHKGGAVAVQTHLVLSSSPELKDMSFEMRNKVPLIP